MCHGTRHLFVQFRQNHESVEYARKTRQQCTLNPGFWCRHFAATSSNQAHKCNGSSALPLPTYVCTAAYRTYHKSQLTWTILACCLICECKQNGERSVVGTRHTPTARRQQAGSAEERYEVCGRAARARSWKSGTLEEQRKFIHMQRARGVPETARSTTHRL